MAIAEGDLAGFIFRSGCSQKCLTNLINRASRSSDSETHVRSYKTFQTKAQEKVEPESVTKVSTMVFLGIFQKKSRDKVPHFCYC